VRLRNDSLRAGAGLLSLWLKALGYRSLLAAGLFVNLQDSPDDRSLSEAIRDITRRAERKAVLIAHASGMTSALRAADAHREWISDVVVSTRPPTEYRGSARASPIVELGDAGHDRASANFAEH